MVEAFIYDDLRDMGLRPLPEQGTNREEKDELMGGPAGNHSGGSGNPVGLKCCRSNQVECQGERLPSLTDLVEDKFPLSLSNKPIAL
ncbi:hypothetical protein DPEC_G00301800 [Dallia pectoralis]|uniref:Uncharacterized protein n=1 Tax=Dallia pectoralis TaxID=75939 RepID=A0ACC2FGV5_DALPE|nr:hypothetical protein DPEC_G00301800 [Dallia pectoralis]